MELEKIVKNWKICMVEGCDNETNYITSSWYPSLVLCKHHYDQMNPKEKHKLEPIKIY